MMKEGVVQLICENMKQMLKENLPRDINCDQENNQVNICNWTLTIDMLQ